MKAKLCIVLSLLLPAAAVAQPTTQDLIGLRMSTEVASVLGRESAAWGTLYKGGSAKWALDTSGNLTGDATNGGNIVFSKAGTGVVVGVAAAVTAAGTDLAGATQLAAIFNNVGTVGASSGVKLFNPTVGQEVVVRNGGAADLKLYPANASGTINGGSAGDAVTLATSGKQIGRCIYAAANTWFCAIATGG